VSVLATQRAFTAEELAGIVERASTPLERLSDRFEPREPDGSAERRRDEWCRLVADGDEGRFARRLRWGGLAEDDLERALGPVRMRDGRSLPDWARDLAELVEHRAGSDRFVRPGLPLAFENVVVPLVGAAAQRLEASVGAGLDRLSAGARGDLERWLARRLTLVMAEPLFVEFATLRSRRLSQLDLLFGDIGTDVYDEFVADMRAGGLAKLLEEHAALARLVATLCTDWCDAAGEFVQRLDSDWDSLTQAFGPAGHVASLETLLSDAHHGGRTVVGVELDSGAGVIYKPRSIENERLWFDLLGWLNDHGLTPPLRRLRTVERDGYGWVERVEREPCRTRAGAARFYERAGALVALTYALGSTDCHYENLIAAGDQPVIVDLETVMSHVRHPDSGAAPSDVIEPFFADSVIRSLLVPRWLQAEAGGAVDVSALGAVESQRSRIRAPVWAGVNTDAMELKEEFRIGEAGANAPELDGELLSPNDYARELRDGFGRAYELLVAHRDELLADGGPVAALADAEVRVIARPTFAYYTVLRRLRTAGRLRDGADFAIQQELLCRRMLDGPEPPPVWELLARERESLARFDCPHFSAAADDDDALDGLPGVLDGSAYERTADRLRELGPADLEKQAGLLAASLDARAMRGGHEAQGPRPQARPSAPAAVPALATPLEGADLVAEAVELAERLERAALRAPDGTVGWVALRFLPAIGRYQLDPVGLDLFGGRAGIALFLAALASTTGDRRWRDLALSTLAPLRKELSGVATWAFGEDVPLHGVTGFSGIAYALPFLATALEDETLLTGEAADLAGLMRRAEVGADEFDVLGGAAGSILALLRVERALGDGDTLATAIALGDKLLAGRTDGAWPTFEGKSIAGFAHGQAGIAYALLELSRASHEERFRSAALDAIAVENELFDPDQRNWADLRWPESGLFPDGWCHGGPGIALSRLGEGFADDVEAGVAVALRNDGEGPDHICCGNAGRAMIALDAGLALGRPDLVEQAGRRLAATVGRARRRGGYVFAREYPGVLAFPGLFQGVAGVGYSLLRSALPDRMASLVLFE
jgi:type 2 lantibiotic biosynthesis protein LanM